MRAYSPYCSPAQQARNSQLFALALALGALIDPDATVDRLLVILALPERARGQPLHALVTELIATLAAQKGGR